MYLSGQNLIGRPLCNAIFLQHYLFVRLYFPYVTIADSHLNQKQGT